jgi:hypothetical protein
VKAGEVISIPPDRHRHGLPREGNQRRDGGKVSQASVWTATPAVDFPGDHFWGSYPRDFIRWACQVMRCDRQKVVHLCSGAIRKGEGALRVDIRPEVHPDIVADCRALPLRDNCAAAVLLDPPYSVEYAQDLYRTEYPRPSALLAEAARIAEPGAPIGFLHFLVPLPPPAARIESVYGVTTGPNYRIRAFTVLRKKQPELPLGSPPGPCRLI